MSENKYNKSAENPEITQDPKQASLGGAPSGVSLNRGVYISSDWLNVSGDVDDFIFYDNHKSVSDR